jgi:uncharacterized protein (TIRG00374 family)
VALRAKNVAVFGLKIAVATVLLTWLARSGNLDFGALRQMLRSPTLVAIDLGVFVVGTLFGTLRWRALLAMVDVRPRFLRLVQLQLSALFFNVVIPGNVGGDVVKALYVARDAKPEARPTILLIVFLERLLGLIGLVVLGSAVVLARGPAIWAQPLLRPMAASVVALGVGLGVGLAVFLLVMNKAGARIAGMSTGTTRFSKIFSQLVSALRLVSSAPGQLVRAVVYSLGIHTLGIGFFTILVRALAGHDVGFAEMATVYPLGILSLILPISPSGLGVGHVAFDKLFDAIGLSGGATVFNVYLLGTITPYLLGIIPYLALKREPVAEPQAADAAAP